MASRMEKYHSNDSDLGKRSLKNESLYRDIYENVRYSNIENVATIEKTNEISLEQIQELLKEREESKKKNVIVKRDIPHVNCEPVLEKNYDICDVLVKAKDEHVEDYSNRSLRNTQYNILKNINIKEKLDEYDEKEIEQTLVNTSVLKSFDDNELCLDMLSDLKSTDNTVVQGNTNLLKEVKEAKDNYEVNNDDGLDRSFYTAGMNFKDDDFEQLKDLQDSIDNNNKLIKILFFLLFVIVLIVITFVLLKLI